MTRGPKPRYEALIRAGALDADPAQEDAVERLQDLHRRVRAYCRSMKRWFGRKKPAPQGLYLWGGVGRGKTLLMDLLYNNADIGAKRRVHFHEFMAEVHERIAAWRTASDRARRRHKAFNKKAPDDPMPPVALDIAQDALLLCFDEFQVTDIADAMILGRLFEALFAQGVIVVATSNRHPDDLYKDGLNRQLFEPFIALLKSKTDVFELRSAKDYRLEKLTGAPVYYYPLNDENRRAMDAAWGRMLSGAREKRETVCVKGRTLIVPRAGRGAARFTFSDLCEKPLGAGDYLTLVQHYGSLFLDNIPAMGPEKRDAARRFINLIDAIYDTRTKLICSAAVEPAGLYTAGDGALDFERTVSRLMEMGSEGYLAAEQRLPQQEKQD